ncbi:thiolase family protein [Thermoleophilia bacterium SCSIO 60948]|nr:thiolase family protein [Thermoleophilia bacterium SCSIO 60948]
MASERPAIIGAAEHAPAMRLDRGFVELHAQAGAQALADAGVAPDEVEGLLVASPMTDEGPIFLSEDVMDYLGLTSLRLEATMNLGGASHLAMARHAWQIIGAGEAETVLCVSCGKFPPIRDVGRQLMGAVCHRDFELPYAPSVPALYGLIAQRWMHETGATKADLAEVPVAQDAWAKRHPTALGWSMPSIGTDEVLSSRPIAGPFSLLDCSIPCEGGGAIVLASADRARRGPHRPVHLLSFGEGHTHGFLSSMREPGRTGAARSGPLALERAERSLGDVDVLQLYDAFSATPLMTLEEMGFAAPGRAADLYREGRTGPGGDLPVNTNGGLIRFGHSGTSSGFTGILEAYWQLAGRAHGAQVPSADCALVHAYGSMLCSHVTVVLEGA